MTLLESQLPEVDAYTATIMETLLKHNTTTTGNILNVEKDILHLAKMIHELQCVTKVQMHFGHVGGIEEEYSSIPEHLCPKGTKDTPEKQ